jgi:hypothetical protein
MHVAHELQELMQQQQKELQNLRGQQEHQGQRGFTSQPPRLQMQQQDRLMQLEAANAELRQQLQGATIRLQEIEGTAKRVMEQQVCSANREVMIMGLFCQFSLLMHLSPQEEN